MPGSKPRLSRVGISGLTTIVAAAVIVLSSGGSAGAVHEMVIEFTVVYGAPGSVVEIATEEVEPWLQGETCVIRVEADNNESARTGTDLLISSGSDLVTVEDVEAAPGVVSIEEGRLVFGETVTVSVRLGPEGRMSAGTSVEFVCDQQPPTTTTATTITTTTAAPTTTSAVPQPTSEVLGTTTVPPTTAVPSTTAPTQVAGVTAAAPAQVAVPVPAEPRFTG